MIKLPAAAQDFIAKLTAPRGQASLDGEEGGSGQFAAPLLEKLRVLMPKGMSVDLRMNETGKYFSAGIFEKVITTIDKSTLLIIGVIWLAALVSMGLAFTAVRDTSQLKLRADVARALDPILPRIIQTPLTKDQYDPLLLRLRKQFPTLAISVTNKPALSILSNNSDEFITWLNSVSYVDSMVSTVRWTLTSFCVGSECPGDNIMQAELTAESINITQPDTESP